MCSTKARLRSERIRHHLIDLLEDHPFEIGLSIALILFGVSSLVYGIRIAPISVQKLPVGLAFAYCTLSIIGGSAVIFALVARWKFVWAYGLERFGLFVSASAWFSYIVGLAILPITFTSTLVILALLGLSAGCLLRARALARNAHATLIALRQADKAKRRGQ